jgi:hypothetical protein
VTCKTSFLLSSSLPRGDLLWSEIHEGKLGPLLYSSGLKIQDRTPSEAWRGQFRHDYIRSSISHGEYRQQVAHLLEAARARDIPMMVLRGTRLAEKLYDDPAVRMYTDIDVLVPRAQLKEMKSLARELGFYRAPGSLSDTFFERNHYHLVYVSPTTGIPLEVHWSLAPPFSIQRINYQELFGRAQQTSIAGVSGLTPAPEDDLILQAVHLTKHASSLQGLSGPRLTALCVKESLLPWMIDLDRFLALHPQLDWNAVADRSRSWEVAGPVLAALNTVAEVLGSGVPRPLRRELERAAYSGTLQHMVGRMSRGRDPLSRGFRALHRRLLGSTAAVCLYPELARFLVPPRAWVIRHAPLRGSPIFLRRLAHTARSIGHMARLSWSLAQQTVSRMVTRSPRPRAAVPERTAAQG